MKNYVIIEDDENKIVSIKGYESNKVSIEKIIDKISKWSITNNKPELIIEEKIIKILDYLFKQFDYECPSERLNKLESAVEEIQEILNRL